MISTLLQWIAVHGYGIIFILLALGIFGLPLPDEWLLAYLGHLVFKGTLMPVPTVAAAFFGSICGMTINYLLGRTFGHYLVRRFGHLVRLTGEKIDRTHDWFEHAGRWGLMVGYFLPGIRHLTAFVAGTAKMTFIEFALYSYAGGFIWCSSFITLGFLLEEGWSKESERIHGILEIGSIAVIAILALIFALHKAKRNEA